jgi:hypothetical protein
MITARDLRARLTWAVAGMSVLDIAVAVILSAYAVALTSGVVHTSHSHVLRLDTIGGSTEDAQLLARGGGAAAGLGGGGG